MRARIDGCEEEEGAVTRKTESATATPGSKRKRRGGARVWLPAVSSPTAALGSWGSGDSPRCLIWWGNFQS
jgi:hypothetical protein